MHVFMTGLTIIMMVVILIPITGVAINICNISDEVVKKWAHFYAVGMSVGIMYTIIGVILVGLSIAVGLIQ